MKSQWQTYKEMELIADFVPAPQTDKSAWMEQASQFLRSLINRCTDRLSPEQQVNHLNQCWKRQDLEGVGSERSQLWHTVWFLLNQPVLELFPTASQEPEIRQVFEGGRAWWYAHDPLTGQEVYLESEDEVYVWIEERLHYY